MSPETSKRYQRYRAWSKLSDRLLQRIFSMASPSPLSNLTCTAVDGLLQSTVVDEQGNPFALFHRGSDADLGVMKQIFLEEDYAIRRFKQSAWVDRAYSQILSQGKKPAIVDAGANIGFGSLYLRHLFPAAQIIAVEPSSSNLKVLSRNLQGLNARVVHGAIHAGASEIQLVDPGEGEWGFSTHTGSTLPASAIESVRCYGFSELIANAETPFLLKVDIEGGEKDQFEDLDFLSRFALIIVELHDWMYPGEKTSDSFLKLAATGAFDFCHRGENVFLFNRSFGGAATAA